MAMLNNQRVNGMIFRCFEHCSYGNSVTEVALSSNPIWRDRRGQRVELEKGGALDGGVIVHQLKMGILVKHHETWDDGFDYQQTNAEKQIP